MRRINIQNGSAHVIVIIVLAIALVGTLGVVFYQNFIAKKATVTDSSAQVSDTKTQSSTSSTTVKAPSQKEYCTQIEGLCFNYPDNWSVSATQEMGTLSEAAATVDQVQIKNKSGEAYLYMTTGISGIGGTCDPSENVDASILETYTTGVKGQYLTRDLSSLDSTAYAVKYVERASKTASQYVAGMYVLNAKSVINPGTVNECSLGYRMITGKGDRGSLKFGTSGFGLDGKGIQSPSRTYSSYDEAVNFLNSDDAKTAYDILKSAHYN